VINPHIEGTKLAK